MFLKKWVLLLLVVFAFSMTLTIASASEKAFDAGPLQLSLFCPLQLLPDDFDVYGLRLTFPYGVNNSVYGLDVGVWNQLSCSLYGVGFAGLVSTRQGNLYGVNTGGIVNIAYGDDVGWSIAGIYNDVDGTVKGLQSTIAYNEAKKVEGVQLAIVNYCENMTGVQLGIVNICKDQPIPFTLFVNVWF
jgi:hypothetical protein